MTNAAFLPLAELFGSRDQFWDLAQTIVPVRDVLSDALANGQLVGSDGNSGLTAAGVNGTASVTSLHDCYLSTLFLTEPRSVVGNTTLIYNIGWYRNLGGTLTQVAYLNLQPSWVGVRDIGITTATTRTFRIEGIPFGTLIRAGDVFSCNFINLDTSALVAAMIVGYRGFQGPPA